MILNTLREVCGNAICRFGFAGNQSDYFIFIVGDFNGPELNSRQPQGMHFGKEAKIKIFPSFKKDANYMFFTFIAHLG